MNKYLISLVFVMYLLFLSLFSSSDYPKELFHGNFMPHLADKPISEDGFYMLTVARNISEGKGIVYNQNIPTTGIQPLATFLYSGVFLFSSIFTNDRIEQLRFIIFLSGIMLIPLAFVIKSIYSKLYSKHLSNDRLTLFALLFTLLNFDLFINFTNGLETGLYILLLALTFNYFISYLKIEKNIKNGILLGILLGLTTLARIDFLIPSLVLYIYFLFKKDINIKSIIAIGLTHLIVILPWLIFTYNITGSIVQSSASSQTSFINFHNMTERLYEWIIALLELITVNISFGNKIIILFILAFLIIVGFVYFYYKFGSNKINFPKPFSPFVIALASLLVIYPVYSSASYFYYRYLIPVSILIIFIIPYLYLIIPKLDRLFSKFNKIIVSLFLFAFLVQAYFYFHSGNLGVPMSTRAGYINAHFDPSDKIGCFQSGVAGCFNENVFNLDGKIDNRALKALHNGEFQKYIEINNINVLIEWREVFNIFDKNYFKKNWKLYYDDIGDGKTAIYIKDNLR